jgi:nucleoside-diphosphate-sugar epimerase
MNILIYGGSGYLGSNLSQYLKKFKHSIVIVSRKKKLPLFSNGIKTVSYDSKKLINYIKLADRIIISNGPTKDECEKNIYNYINFFEKIFINLKKFIKKNCKIIYLSSIHVYNQKIHSIKESDLCLSNSSYAVKNLLCEHLIKKIFCSNRSNFIIIRLANIFGILEEKHIVNKNFFSPAINNFCLKILLKNQIKIKSNINEKRNYIYINDFLFFIGKVIRNKNVYKNDILNFASDQVVSTKTLIKIICDVSKKLKISGVRFLLNRDVKNKKISHIKYSFNNKKIEKMINFEKNTIANGIEQTFLNLKKNSEKNLYRFK